MILTEARPSYKFTPEDVSAQIKVQKDTSWDENNYNKINVKNALIKAGASEPAAKLMLSFPLEHAERFLGLRKKSLLTAHLSLSCFRLWL